MNPTPPEGVTCANEVTLKQPHCELFLAAVGTSPRIPGQPRSGELVKKFPAGPSASTDPLPQSI